MGSAVVSWALRRGAVRRSCLRWQRQIDSHRATNQSLNQSTQLRISLIFFFCFFGSFSFGCCAMITKSKAFSKYNFEILTLHSRDASVQKGKEVASPEKTVEKGNVPKKKSVCLCYVHVSQFCVSFISKD
jgi:hypothetical protein